VEKYAAKRIFSRLAIGLKISPDGVRRRPEDAAGEQERRRREHEASRAVLDDLVQRGLRRPEFFIVDGAPGARECDRRGVERRAGAALHGGGR